MKIPQKIQVGGITYQVEDVEPDSHELVNGTTIGHIYYDKQLIVLAKNMRGDRKAQTFTHEIIHAILLAMGISGEQEIVLDERFIDAFSSYLHQVMEQI